MAEFCLDCWNKINRTHLSEEDVTLSEYFDLCEECEEMKPVVETMYPSHTPCKILQSLRTLFRRH